MCKHIYVHTYTCMLALSDLKAESLRFFKCQPWLRASVLWWLQPRGHSLLFQEPLQHGSLLPQHSNRASSTSRSCSLLSPSHPNDRPSHWFQSQGCPCLREWKPGNVHHWTHSTCQSHYRPSSRGWSKCQSFPVSPERVLRVDLMENPKRVITNQSVR